jgi:hypothetical protein
MTGKMCIIFDCLSISFTAVAKFFMAPIKSVFKESFYGTVSKTSASVFQQ